MPPTLDTIEGRILAEVKKVLEDTIVSGTSYFYQPDIVALVDPPPMQYADDHEDSTQLYIIHEEDINVDERTSGKRMKIMEVFINGLRKHEPENTDPIDAGIKGEESRASIRAKMRHDVEKVLDLEVIRLGGKQLDNLVDNIDYHVGRVVRFLKDIGEYDNTVVILFSDNGPNPWFSEDYPGNRGSAWLAKFDNNLKKVGHPGSNYSYGTGWAASSSGPLDRAR